MALRKSKGPLLTSVFKGMLDLLPPKWRARLETTVTDQENPTDVGVSALSNTLVESKVVQTRTDERKKTDTVIEDPTNISLIEYLKTNEAQLGTRTNRLVVENAALPTITALTVSAEQNNLGNGKTEQEIVTVAEVFDRKVNEDSGAGDFVFRQTEKFIDTLVVRTDSEVAAGTSATPDTLATTGTGIIRASAERVDATKVKNTTTTVTGSYTSLNSVEYDELTGGITPVVQSRVAAGTAGLALQTDNTFATVEALNPNYSIKTVRTATSLTTRTWKVWENVSLPQVLTTFTSFLWTDKEHLDRYGNDAAENGYPAHLNPYHINPGGNILSATFIAELTDYSGAYEVTVVESFDDQPHVLDGQTVFRPKGFAWETPFGSGRIPPCLHADITISGTTGTTHPKFAFGTWSYAFAATSPATLSGTIVIQDTQEPYKGGWRRVKKSITI